MPSANTIETTNGKVKVLVIDDSAVARKILSTGLSKDPGIEVVGVAADPFIARDKILRLEPDVLTLDVEMPRMDGLTFLKKLMTYYPMPVIMVSSLTQAGCETTFKALELGAIDFVAKPQYSYSSSLEDIIIELASKIKGAAKARVRNRPTEESEVGANGVCPPRTWANAIRPYDSRLQNGAMIKTTHKIVAIGASTGGTEALRDVLVEMPPNAPPIVIVQHMPEVFTKAFAERLNSMCSVEVKEAKNGDSVIPGVALIAPGNYHLTLARDGARYIVETNQKPPINHHRPSVEMLFNSVAHYAGSNAIGVIMTGMGADGATGLLKMKNAGAKTIAQDEESCVVFGMPKEAIKLGAIDKVVPLNNIPETILSFLN
ncbi:MAG: chemotaxis response regulator protein-glutamate methylesterase [Candidatus Brocadiales bacterium]|nr:chemotaxis response regulator protein-glutamate methylesterase [Planctomycetota bacterium]MDO8094329.1 chemotaxis response regulator protein-glutamate methylesterase [Candidatus Brocadiales bacterium]